MKTKRILFQGDMVRAILGGRKTQTRRIVNPQFGPDAEPEEMCAVTPEGWQTGGHSGRWWDACEGNDEKAIFCLYGQPGDLLYVQETWAKGWNYGGGGPVVFYRATGDGWIGSERHPPADVMNGRFGTSSREPACSAPSNVKWTPSIHMPRWASRLALEITGVRVERVQDISEEDANAEGLKGLSKDGSLTKYGLPDADGLPGNDDSGWHWAEWCASPRDAFRKLWDSINEPRGYGWDANPWVWVIEFRAIQANVDDVLARPEQYAIREES